MSSQFKIKYKFRTPQNSPRWPANNPQIMQNQPTHHINNQAQQTSQNNKSKSHTPWEHHHRLQTLGFSDHEESASRRPFWVPDYYIWFEGWWWTKNQKSAAASGCDLEEPWGIDNSRFACKCTVSGDTEAKCHLWKLWHPLMPPWWTTNRKLCNSHAEHCKHNPMAPFFPLLISFSQPIKHNLIESGGFEGLN